MGNYKRKDYLYRKAKSDGYRSRAAYKLLELDQKFALLSSARRVVDLGCAPGGWLQVVLERTKPGASIVGIDLEEIETLESLDHAVSILTGDISDERDRGRVIEALGAKADLVLSDMSPKLTGIKFQDDARAAGLIEEAFLFAADTLVPGGNLVMKIFPGSDTDVVLADVARSFTHLRRIVLKSSRSSSKEYYSIATGFQGSGAALATSVAE